MNSYTTKPVIYLRIPTNLYSLPFADAIIEIACKIFKPQEIAPESRDVLKLAQLKYSHPGVPVISLCKHTSGNINLDVSRVYSEDLKFIRFKGFDSLEKMFFKENLYIIFDEDVGGGYATSCLQAYLRDFKKVNSKVVTTIRFDPKKEELLDLKDFIYKFDKTSGLVVNTESDTTKRVSYIERFDILDKFASINMEHAEKISIVFFVISAYYHKEFCNKRLYDECLQWLLSFNFDIKLIDNLNEPSDLTLICLNILKGYH